MSKSLENKIILITGGHSGIGFQASLEFAKEGELTKNCLNILTHLNLLKRTIDSKEQQSY